jgi:hypothetical protein
MNKTAKRLVYLTPRIICIAFAAFLSIFAMDVFSMRVDFWRKALALLVHLIPTALVLVALTVGWRREWIGVVVFPLLAVFHLVTKWGQFHWSVYAVIDGPLLLMAILFWVNWSNQATLRPSTR